MFLRITSEVCAAVADDQCINDVRLTRDWAQGRCAAAFPPQPSPGPRTGTADTSSTTRGA